MIHTEILSTQNLASWTSLPDTGCDNALQKATKVDSVAVFSQLTALASYAEELFCGLLNEVQERHDRLQMAADDLDSIKNRIPEVEVRAKNRKPWDSHASFEQPYEQATTNSYVEIFSQQNRPRHLQRQFEQCEAPPDFSPLQPYAPLNEKTKKQIDLSSK